MMDKIQNYPGIARSASMSSSELRRGFTEERLQEIGKKIKNHIVSVVMTLPVSTQEISATIYKTKELKEEQDIDGSAVLMWKNCTWWPAVEEICELWELYVRIRYRAYHYADEILDVDWETLEQVEKNY